jgi:hypothetical protein
MSMKAGAASLLVLLTAAVAPPASTIFAGGAWAAIDRNGVCDALSRAQRIAAKGQVQAIAGFTFTADHRRWGEFHARLSRVPRAGSSVMLTISGQPFLLVARGDWAWSRGPLQEQAIIAAARDTTTIIRVEARDGAGRRFVDSYLPDGAPTAIDAAAARCSLRGAGKIR